MITNKTFDEITIGDSAKMQRALTKQDIDLFGLLSGDMNPTHFSDAYALMLLERRRLVGHSMWSGVLISSLLGNELPGPGTAYRSQNFEFHNAVELGDTLTITVAVTSKDVADGTVVFDCRAVNQRNEPIITGVARVKAPTRKPTDAGSPYATLQLHRKTAFKELIDHVKDWPKIPTAVCHLCSKEAALIKGIVSPVAGEADILLVPDLEAGNMLAKQLSYLAKADSAGIVLGARVPIILTSRADSAEARLASCAVAAAFAYRLRENQQIKRTVQG